MSLSPSASRREGGSEPPACISSMQGQQPARLGERLPFVGLKSHKLFLVRADGCAGGVPQKITWLKKVFQEHSLPLMGLPVLQTGWFCCSLIKRIIFFPFQGKKQLGIASNPLVGTWAWSPLPGCTQASLGTALSPRGSWQWGHG